LEQLTNDPRMSFSLSGCTRAKLIAPPPAFKCLLKDQDGPDPARR
jgi:hypothetical protein